MKHGHPKGPRELVSNGEWIYGRNPVVEALRAGREFLFGGIALLSIALGVVSLGKKRQTL